MQAIYLSAPSQFEIRQDPEPERPGPGEVALRMRAVGVCGSDIHYFKDGKIGAQVLSDPWILGHECVAEVEALGRGVSGLQPGQRVAVEPLIHCGDCAQCRAGRVHTCLNQRFLGCPGQLPGSMREKLVMPAECCLPVGDQLSDGAAVMVEPFAIALHALRQLALGSNRPSAAGMRLGILGAGPVGLCVLGAARLEEPAYTWVADPLAYRCEMAKSLGAAEAGAPGGGPAPGSLDAVFECAGEPEAIDAAVELLTPGGTLVIVGIPQGNRISFDINQLRRKELTVKNVRRQNGCTLRAIELLSQRRLDLDPVVTHHFSAADSLSAYQLVAGYRQGVGKALIHFAR